MIEIYLSIGIGFYIGFSVNNLRLFKKADVRSILRGFIFGVLLWPIAIIVKLTLLEDKNHEK